MVNNYIQVGEFTYMLEPSESQVDTVQFGIFNVVQYLYPHMGELEATSWQKPVPLSSLEEEKRQEVLNRVALGGCDAD